MNTKKYQYNFTGSALGPYRQHTINHTVENLDPDGFIATADVGDAIIDDIDWGDVSVCENWDDGGENIQRRLVWDNEDDSINDDGMNATGEIERELIC